MPGYFPEGNEPKPNDDELRSLHKYCDQLYQIHGNQGPGYYPEGSQPLPGDDEERLTQKINAMLN